MIIALAGRRVDAPDTPTRRFPLENVDAVRERLRSALQQHHAAAVVASAACGADLLALEVAGELGLRRRIILPFARAEFREASVMDRPGDWGALYDRICDEVEAAGDLVVLNLNFPDNPDRAFEVTSDRIVEEALQLADEQANQQQRSGKAMAIVVWDQAPRGADDLTVAFANEAIKHKMPVISISTL
jgi:hypothetical protein